MMTLRQLAAEPPTLPTRMTWYLTDLAEARGKQELFTGQSPQRLKVLREHALIESAISSNRIEDVEVDNSRVGTLIRQELGDFHLADIERACPGVGREWIRTLLAGLKATGEVSCQGKGPAARWRQLGSKGIKL